MVYCLLRSDLSPILAIICICTVYDCVNGTLPSAFLFVAVFKVEYYCDIIIQVTLVFTEKTRIENEIPEIGRGTVITVSLLLLRRRLSSWCESGICGWIWWNVEPQRGRLAHMHTLTYTCTPTHTHTYAHNKLSFIYHIFVLLGLHTCVTLVSQLFIAWILTPF